MAASIALSDLAYATPDGRSLFSSLGLSFGLARTGLVGRNGVGKTTLLKLISGELRPRAGRVFASGRVAILRQVVRVDPDQTIVGLFGVTDALAKLRFRSDAALPEVRTLSGGERLRVGLACVLGVIPPPLLILDEPTNHLDVDAIEAVEAGLRAYEGRCRWSATTRRSRKPS